MAMCMAKPIGIGLRPSGKSWRHRRPRSPDNPPRKRSAGRLYVRKPPRALRGPAKRGTCCTGLSGRALKWRSSPWFGLRGHRQGYSVGDGARGPVCPSTVSGVSLDGGRLFALAKGPAPLCDMICETNADGLARKSSGEHHGEPEGVIILGPRLLRNSTRRCTGPATTARFSIASGQVAAATGFERRARPTGVSASA
jgi:hypothetical protein